MEMCTILFFVYYTILELNTESYRMNAAKLAKSHSHKLTKKTEENDMKIT